MDYLSFYSLDEDPFRFTPDPDFFYPSHEHNEVLLSLDYLVQQREGFLLVTGEPGTGKTLTLKIFMDRWKDNAEIALVMTPRLNPEEFLMTIVDDLGIPVEGKSKNEILKGFRDFLISTADNGKKSIIIVDEAQLLPDETLEELRLLSNLETEKDKLLQIILIGQPELAEKLNHPHLRQLDQRITVRSELHHFTQPETFEYISFRLAKAGKGLTIFEEKAKELIHRLSSGIPRQINVLASRSLMSGYIEESRTINERHVQQAHAYIKQHAKISDRSSPNIFSAIRSSLRTTAFARVAKISATVAAISAISYASIHFLSDSSSVKTPKPATVNKPTAALHEKQDARQSEHSVISAIQESAPVTAIATERLPAFINGSILDKDYSSKNPGWEKYTDKSTEYRVLRGNSKVIKGIQVIDRSGKGISTSRFHSMLKDVSDKSFEAESREKKDGFIIERGKVGNSINSVLYRDNDSKAKIRAFVLDWP